MISFVLFHFFTILTVVESTPPTFYTVDNKLLVSLILLFVGNFPALLTGFVVFSFIYYILKYITGKPFLCGTIELIVLYVLATISFIKMKMLGVPVFISDAKFLGGMGDVTKLVSISDIPTLLGVYGFILIGFIAVSLVLFKFFSEKGKTSWKIPIILFVILGIIFIPSVFKVLVHEPEASIKDYYSEYGFISALYREYLHEQIDKPKDYNEESVKSLLDGESTKSANWGKPNVVFVLAEAFWDIDKIQEIKFDKDPLLGYKNVQQNGKVINMISPTFAGMTTNVEYEILAGYPMRNFVEGYIPYNTLYVSKEFSELPTLVNDFKNGGYKSVVYSPFDEGDVYNVKNVYKYLGFEEINLKSSVLTEERKRGKFVSDEYMYSLIPERINETEEPLFMFVKTVQNHMPYEDKYMENELNINVVSTELNEYETSVVRNYGQGIYDASTALENLYNEIQNINEPTVVVFFGDHLPSLTTLEGEDIISTLKHFQDEELVNLYEKHHTQSVILSNYDINIDSVDSMGFDMFGSFILNHIDIKESPYFAFKNKYFDDYIGGYGGVFIDKNNNILSEDDLTDKQIDFMNNMEKVWYYYFKKIK